MKSKSLPYPPLLRALAWIILASTALAVVWARVRLAGLPLERDEGEYAYTGQLLLHGIPPYKLAYSMKFPGTAAVYALLRLIFGESSRGIHLGLIVVNLLSTSFIFLIARKLFGELAAVSSAAAFLVLSLMPHVLGQAAHATHFVVLFATAGTLILLRAMDRESPLLTFGAGVLSGLAVIMKQPGFFFVLFGSVYLLGCDWWRGGGVKRTVLRNLVFLCGASLPCIITALALWIAGVFGTFWFWTIQYATQYGERVSARLAIEILSARLPATLGTAWPIWVLAAAGLTGCGVVRNIRNGAGFVTTFAIFSALAVCPGFYFRPHYFILFLPALSLLAGCALVAAVQLVEQCPKLRIATLLIFALCLIWPLWSERDFFFELPLDQANRLVNGTNPFPEAIQVGRYLQTNTTADDSIAVLGSEPEIYFYADRRAATGYIYTYSLMEPQPYAHRMQEEMIHEIETGRPKFLILVVVAKSWLASRDSDQTIFRWADSYCDAYYDEVGLVNISETGTSYYLNGKPPGVAPAPEHILIYRRKT